MKVRKMAEEIGLSFFFSRENERKKVREATREAYPSVRNFRDLKEEPVRSCHVVHSCDGDLPSV